MFNWLYSALSSPKQGEVWELKNINLFNAKHTVVIDEIREKWVMYTTAEQSFFLGNKATRTLPISEFKQSFRKAL